MAQFTIATLGTLSWVLLSHGKIGEYPEPQRYPNNPRREWFEVLIIFILNLGSISYLIYSRYLNDYYYPSIRLLGFPITLHLFLVFTLPVIIELLLHRRSLSDLGFRLPLDWKPASALILFALVMGWIASHYDDPDPLGAKTLLWYLVTPSLSEEWLYRSVLQTKLERLISIEQSWIISGIFFGLSHIPTDFFGPLWVASDMERGTAFLRLFSQITYGWLFGVLYSKSKSIFPGVFAHYLSDFLPYFL